MLYLVRPGKTKSVPTHITLVSQHEIFVQMSIMAELSVLIQICLLIHDGPQVTTQALTVIMLRYVILA